MINLKKIVKTASLSALILSQTMTPMSSVFPDSFRSFLGPQVVHAASADPSGITPKSALIYGETDTEQLKAKIFSDPDFISTYAWFADKLGFGWCGGTDGRWDSFDFSKSGDDYILQAHYDPNQTASRGYRDNERLKMTISNVKFYLDPNSIKYDPMQASDPQPFLAAMAHINNGGDTPLTASPSLSYQIQTQKSHASTAGFSENIGLKESLEQSGGIFGFAGVKHSTELSFNFTAQQGWTDTKTESLTGTINAPTTVTVPPHSTVNVSMQSLKLNYSAGYTANVYVSYTITYHGFLRYQNGRADNTHDRPTVDVTFGNKDKNISAVEDIMNQYNHRNIPGYSNWNWDWVANYQGQGAFLDNLAYIMRQRGAVNVGKFEFKDCNDITVTADAAKPYSGTQQGVDWQLSGNTPQTAAQTTQPSGTSSTPDASIKIIDYKCPITIAPTPTLVKIPHSQMGAADYNGAVNTPIDDNPSTIWTSRGGSQGIALSLGGTYNISQIKYLPRQDSSSDGTITNYKIYVSTDNINFTEVATGTWANDKTEKTAQFNPVNAAYVWIGSSTEMPVVSAAEVNVYHN